MCGRFTLTRSAREIAGHFSLGEFQDFLPRYNIAPGQNVAVVRVDSSGDKRLIENRVWGLVPPRSKKPNVGSRMINARSESAAERPAFREALATRRCLIPADGFYEWSSDGVGPRAPYYIQDSSRGLFGFAGLFEHWDGSDGQTIDSCTILTVPSSGCLERIHTRMPLVLTPSLYQTWLGGEGIGAIELVKITREAQSNWILKRVGLRVNSTRHDGPGCLEPDPGPANLELFSR